MKRSRWLHLSLTLYLLLSLFLTPALALTKAPEAGTGTAHGVGLCLVDSFPADGDTDIGFMPTIYCKFNHNICDTNISPGNLACLSLVTAAGEPVAANAYVIDPQIDFLMRQFLILEPAEPLAPSTTYEVRMAPGITARNGMVTEQTFAFRFTTGAEDRVMGDPFEDSGSSQSVTLSLAETWPLADMENVPLGTTLEFRFDHNVTGPDLLQGNLSRLSLSDSYGVPVEVSTFVDDSSADFTQRQILRMKPVAPLLPNTGYTATVTAGITANNGAVTTRDYTLHFTTGAAPVTEPVPAEPDARPTPKPVPEAKPRETPAIAPTPLPEVTQPPAETAAATPVPTATAVPTPSAAVTPTAPALPSAPAESPLSVPQQQPEGGLSPLVVLLPLGAVVILLLVLLHRRRH